jgi:hypothetical protein
MHKNAQLHDDLPLMKGHAILSRMWCAELIQYRKKHYVVLLLFIGTGFRLNRLS